MTARRHGALVNLVSLTSIQVSNAALPLLIFPFTLSVLGTDLYAKVALSEGLSIVLLTVVLYSFEIDGVAKIASLDAVADSAKVSETFSAVFYLRLFLFAVGAPFILLAAAWMDRQLLPLALGWLLVPLSYAVQSNWLFQGLERNAPVAIFTVISRAMAVVLVLTQVDGPPDYARVPALIGIAYAVGALGSITYAHLRLGVRLVPVESGELRQMLWSGKELFLGNLSVILYRDINVVVLGAVGATGSSVAAYSMAEKITKVIQASMRPLNQLFLPRALRIANAAQRPTPVVFRQLLRITWPQMALLTSMLLVLLLVYTTLGPHIPWLQSFPNANRIAVLVALMSLVPLLGTPNYILGWAGLGALGSRRYLLGALVSTAVISLALCVPLTSLFADNGAAACFVAAEGLLLAMVLWKYLR